MLSKLQSENKVLSIDFEELIREFHPMMYKICRVYASDEDFDDLYQEVLISLWKSYSTFKGDSKLSTWVYRVVLNTALTYHRNEKRAKSKFGWFVDKIPDAIEEIPVPPKNQVEKLYQAIGQLPKLDRSVVLLYLEEKTYDEISEIMGITPTNVGVKINRIKKRLLKILKTI